MIYAEIIAARVYTVLSESGFGLPASPMVTWFALCRNPVGCRTVAPVPGGSRGWRRRGAESRGSSSTARKGGAEL